MSVPAAPGGVSAYPPAGLDRRFYAFAIDRLVAWPLTAAAGYLAYRWFFSEGAVWAGVGLVRGGAGTALVGSHQEVADRLEEYHRIGIDEFILSGYPHVEEAYWFAEGVVPVLRSKGIYGPEALRQERRLESVQFL